MKSLPFHPWRLMGILTSVALVFLCNREWNVRKTPSPLIAQPDKLRKVPKLIGFTPPKAVTRGESKTVHAASALELPGGDLLSYWFGGTREGHRDVSIWTSRWDIQSKTWSTPAVCLERRWLEDETGLNIRKLGNPVVFFSEGKVELFVVGVSTGGWSGSAIYHLISDDEGLTFHSPRRLITSPFLNISTLVRNAAVPLADGKSLALPTYHEFAVKYPYWIQLNEDREVTYLRSEQQANGFLQPSQISAGGHNYTFLRDTHDDGAVHLLKAATNTPEKSSLFTLPIPNPNSGLAALALKDGVLLACNDTSDKRHQLSLLFQQYDALEDPWQVIYRPETPERKDDEQDVRKLRYSYPWLLQASDGSIHLFYTWNRRQIRHFHFDAKDWPTPSKAGSQ